MRWRGRRQSSNVEDRRGFSGRRAAGIGGMGGLGLVVVLVVAWALGADPMQLLHVGLEQEALAPLASDGELLLRVGVIVGGRAGRVPGGPRGIRSSDAG